MTDKEYQQRIEEVLLRKIEALQERKKLILARKHVIGSSKPEEFIDEEESRPIEKNLSYAGIKRDLIVSDCDMEIVDIENDLVGREAHLEQTRKEIERLTNGKQENGNQK